MSTVVAHPSHRAAPPQALPGSRFDNVFFSTMALLILVTVFVGFARTYFLAGVFRAPLPNLLIHLHGAVFSGWILLLMAQISLVSAGRVDIHRRLGLAGFTLACLMLILGVLAASDALRRGVSPPGSGLDPRTFYAIPLGDMAIFAVLIFFAFRLRTHPAAHKRLILISTIALMDAPTGRPPFVAVTGTPLLGTVFCWLFLLLLVAYDVFSTRKVHRATLCAGIFVIIAEQLRVPIGNTHAWHVLAGWVQSIAR